MAKMLTEIKKAQATFIVCFRLLSGRLKTHLQTQTSEYPYPIRLMLKPNVSDKFNVFIGSQPKLHLPI
jgi:hypothetical protein